MSESGHNPTVDQDERQGQAGGACEQAQVKPDTAAAPVQQPSASSSSRYPSLLSTEDLEQLYIDMHITSIRAINAGDYVPQKMVLIVRTDVGMSVGKKISQAAHAAVGAFSQGLGLESDSDEFEDEDDEEDDSSESRKGGKRNGLVENIEDPGATAKSEERVHKLGLVSDEDRRSFVNHWRQTGAKKIAVKGVWADIASAGARAKAWGVTNYLIHDAGKTQVDPGTATVLAIGPAPEQIVNLITSHLQLM